MGWKFSFVCLMAAASFVVGASVLAYTVPRAPLTAVAGTMSTDELSP